MLRTWQQAKNRLKVHLDTAIFTMATLLGKIFSVLFPPSKCCHGGDLKKCCHGEKYTKINVVGPYFSSKPYSVAFFLDTFLHGDFSSKRKLQRKRLPSNIAVNAAVFKCTLRVSYKELNSVENNIIRCHEIVFFYFLSSYSKFLTSKWMMRY